MISTLIVALAFAALASPLLSLCGRIAGWAVEQLTASAVWRERAWALGFHLPAAGVLQVGAVGAVMALAPSASVAATPARLAAHGSNVVAAGAVLAVCGVSLALRVLFLRRRQRQLASRLLRDAQPLPPFGATLPVVTSLQVGSPMLLGVRGPVIVLPAGLVAECASEPLVRICAHEAAHRRRGDNLKLLAEEALHAAFWFNPLMAGLKARMRAAREEVCDEIALAGASAATRRLYAEALVRTCRRPSAAALQARFVGEGRSIVRQPIARRVAAILSPPSRPTRMVRAALCALLLAAGLTATASAALALELTGAPPPVLTR